MEFYETLPMRKLSPKQRNLWETIYQNHGQPQGHSISSTSKSAVCDCFTCAETVRQIKRSTVKA